MNASISSMNLSSPNKDVSHLKEIVYKLDEKTEALAKLGELRFRPSIDWFGKPSIFVEKRVSQASGFGTASTRKIVVESLKAGFDGRFHNIAANSSHLFHLYMGMVPVKFLAKFKEMYGMQGEAAINAMQGILDKIYTKEELSDQEKRQLNTLKGILRDLKNLGQNETVTDQMIDDCKDDLRKFKEEVLISFDVEFIPKILDILERNPTERQPVTSSLGIKCMVLSDLGLQRWKEAIKDEKTFIPFKKLEHLECLMTADQKSRLDVIVKKRFNLNPDC